MQDPHHFHTNFQGGQLPRDSWHSDQRHELTPESHADRNNWEIEMRTALFVTTLGFFLALAGCKPKEADTSQPDQAASQPAPEPAPAPAQMAAEGEMCGGIAGIQCAEGQYCAMEVGQCGVADGSGTCKTKPEVCTEEYAAVCGCDGTTYSNACTAAAAGVNVSATGECPAAVAGQT